MKNQNDREAALFTAAKMLQAEIAILCNLKYSTYR
ncbi:hypothetical protein HMPREF9020_01537 [Scardovia inopinata F0304]|uniref:Uncharacterized protein n=1 Tax=Scardovia inopinata F0304 TaxID=641146 RepID=W1MXA3_SCAIO|nr:hypothetical protein HMPREF9020_01537 [Scardovia inopinata F0304]